MPVLSGEPSTFDRCGDATLARVRKTYAGRGMAYGDTWALENQRSALTRYVLALPRKEDDPGWMRLLQLATLIDVKDSRLLGGGNVDDSLIDGIAYRAVFTQLLAERNADE